jgi:GDP-4-dehydro-6-deoxy-D-mannose reductase
MRLLVTGADGFVGRWLVQAAIAAGHHVVAAIAPGRERPAGWHDPAGAPAEVVTADLRESAGIDRLAATHPEAVVHLAAVASGAAARQDPAAAWALNAGATAALAEQLAGNPRRPRFLHVSTAEVYGRDHAGPIAESAGLLPCSPYAASKVGGEVAVMEVRRRAGLPVIIARPFPHTGPGQAPIYVLPALVQRLREAARRGASQVPVGNLGPIRDFLDVRDVVRAYLSLLERGQGGEVYNVASGEGRRLADCFATLARMVGSEAHPVQDASLLRTADIPALVGDATKLRSATGWSPAIPFDRTLQDLVDAQAD